MMTTTAPRRGSVTSERDIYLGVLERDNNQCRSCGTGGENRLHVHHIVHRSRGGGHDAANLVTVCWQCHNLLHAHKLSISLVLLNGKLEAFCNRRHP